MPSAASVARDLSRFDDRPRVRQAVAAEQAEAPIRVLPRTAARAQVSLRPLLRGATVFFCVVALMLFIVYAYTQTAEMANTSQRLARDIARLQQEGTVLKKQKSDRIDWTEIERIAVEELGMVKPARNQILYINLSGEDHAEVLRSGQ